MKKLFRRGVSLSLACCAFSLCTTSCENQEVGNGLPGESIPISFSTKITKVTTKATEDAFEVGDRVGLFATLSSGNFSTERYIDNLCLKYTPGNVLMPEKEVFYPDGNATLEFFSYYPYQKAGMDEGTTTLTTYVLADQSNDRNYSESDFMVAHVEGVQSSPNPVQLTFEHRFAKLKFILTPQEGETASDILENNPHIIVSGLKTEANYDFQTQGFSDAAEESNIIPHGEWIIDNEGNVSGKSCIVIPQPIEEGIELALEWDGKLYRCSIETSEIVSDTEISITIEAIQTQDGTLDGIVTNIEEWGSNEEITTESQYHLNSVCVSALSFEKSQVYRVYSQGKSVAEICKEYLYREESPNPIASRAIVLYAVNGEQTDFSKGTVLQLLDTIGAVHGGTVSWNTSDNSFSYTPGTSQPIETFYINEDKSIVFDKPESPATVNVSSYLLRDLRNGVKTYPIVKIETQYWMGDDLNTTYYNDGEEIERKSELGNGAGYFAFEGYDMVLFNGEAVLTGKLAPEGWKIPTVSEWDRLINYVHNNAYVLRGNVWQLNGKQYPATNETGLTIHPNGIFSPIKVGLVNPTTSVVYWSSGEDGSPMGENSFMFDIVEDDVQKKQTMDNDTYYAFSIRCIKE